MAGQRLGGSPVAAAAAGAAITWAAFAAVDRPPNAAEAGDVLFPLMIVLAALAALVCMLRWRLVGGRSYLLAGAGLATVASVRAVVGVWPAVVGRDDVLVPVVLALVMVAGAAMLGSSALAARSTRASHSPRHWTVAAFVLAVAVLAAQPGTARMLAGVPSGAAGHLAIAAVWLWVAWLHRSRAGSDGFHRWVAAMLLLAANSRVALVLPGVWVTASHVFVVEATIALLAGTLLALRSDLARHQRELAVAAGALDEVAASQRQLLDHLVEHRHDLQSAVFCIGGTTTLLDEGWFDMPSADKRMLVRALRAEVDRVQSLVSAADAGEARPSRVQDLLQPLVLVDRGRGRDVRLADDGSESAGGLGAEIVVMVRPHQVGEIVRNLLDNAYRYAPHSPVVVTTRVVDDNAHVVVADHGPGVPPNEREAVFVRGYRSNASDPAGMGLGLVISRRLARRQGGDLWVEETPGGGASFVLSLPLAADLERSR